MRHLIVLIATLAMMAGHGHAQQVQRIAAIVNDDIVSVYDLEARMKMVIQSAGLQPSRELTQRLGPQVLRGLIDERLRLQEAKRRSITVTKRDMDSAVAMLEKQNNLQPGKFDEFLQSQGISKDTVMDQIRGEVAWAKLVNQRLAPRIAVGPDEVAEVLARMKAQQGETEYHLAEILLTVDKPEALPEVQRTAQRLVEQIRMGAQFSAVARQFSQSPSASVGGDLGWIPEAALSEELRGVVPTLEERKVAAPITTVEGVEVLMLLGKRRILGPNPNDITLRLNRIVLPIPEKASAGEMENQMELARTLSETVTGCEDLARAGKEAGAVGSPDLGKLRLGDIAAKLRDTVQDLPVGKASTPIRDRDGVSIFMVCERNEPPSALPSAEEIERRLRNERVENAARRYMRDLRYAAVVDLRV